MGQEDALADVLSCPLWGLQIDIVDYISQEAAHTLVTTLELIELTVNACLDRGSIPGLGLFEVNGSVYCVAYCQQLSWWYVDSDLLRSVSGDSKCSQATNLADDLPGLPSNEVTDKLPQSESLRRETPKRGLHAPVEGLLERRRIDAALEIRYRRPRILDSPEYLRSLLHQLCVVRSQEHGDSSLSLLDEAEVERRTQEHQS